MKRICFFFVLAVVVPVLVFAQQTTPTASALRDYVGLINQSYHPGIVAYFQKIKEDLVKEGKTDAVRSIDIFLGGATGSGFVFNDDSGNLYMITNYHVIAQADTLSITFERQDGFKKKMENLKIIAVDEETDLALLAFAAGDKPVDTGLSFLTRPVEEGEDVYSAGFPGLGITAIWQLGRGMVSNAAVRFPKSITDETLMGPFIQHTAQIDPGNSGGPLLVAQQNVPSGYAVAGINTLSSRRRQAANYAIPVSTARTFINNALNPKPETYRAALDQRLAKFVEGLGVNRAVYPHIAEFLSSASVGENAEFAMSEMYDKGTASIRRAFVDKCEDSVVGAMGYAVAWIIENSMRTTGTLRASIKDVTGAGEEYTVVFTVNGKDHSSKWVLEYGTWRIRTFGTVAAGDTNLLSQKEAQKKAAERLRTNSNFHFEAGYANLFEKAPFAWYFAIEYMQYVGLKLYYADSDFWAIGFSVGTRFDIPVGNFAIMPYIRGGLDYQHDQEYEDIDAWASGFPVSLMGQVGVKVTSTYVPGLFAGLGFQYNVYSLHNFGFADEDYNKMMKMAFTITVGYAF